MVTLSTTEVEFVAASFCATQCVWMRRILEQIEWKESTAIKLSKNSVLHGRSKHIDVRFHFLRDLENEGVVRLKFCGTYE